MYYKRLRFTFISVLLFFNTLIFSQGIPSGYFIQPIDGVLQLSGTFAELRGGHFHSGIDLRTNSKEGFPVYAAAEGYVVRIKIQPGGFGKAVYINHPNGYTTVYAHLLSFNEAINNYTRAKQYEAESFEVDLFPPKGLLMVSKGDIIALSGNSGASEGPHLHFEIRETDTELPVDPLLFDLPVKDWIRPTMHGLRVYPEGSGSFINGSPLPASFSLVGWGPVYRLKITDTIEVAGKFSLGLNATDLLNETSNRNGVVRYSVFIDSVPAFEWQAVKFAFNETRYVNSFIDYPYYYATNQRYMRTHTDPGNKLSMYTINPAAGVFSTRPGSLHYVKVVVADSKNNESILRFIVKATGKPVKSASEPGAADQSGLLFTINKLNTFAIPGMRISLPGKCLYDSIRFRYSEQAPLPNSLSRIYQVHKPEVPLQDYFDLSVKTDTLTGIPSSRLTVVRLNAQNKPSAAGGKYENGFMRVKVRDFGRYAVMADTIAPVIKGVNITNGIDISGLKNLKVTISDNLSGIKSYRATLNGSWILMDYDAKNRLLTYEKDALLLPGENVMILTVTDGVGNNSVMQWMLKNEGVTE
ncbi:MAG TPA: M23 family metallopeptidase [Lentimicrobium sp.]|nr:M23 family metallopeptidase [Bacteroidales bacterium]HLO89818.1 M23 family metallopeptidase [Lentimicrobium sp.]